MRIDLNMFIAVLRNVYGRDKNMRQEMGELDGCKR